MASKILNFSTLGPSETKNKVCIAQEIKFCILWATNPASAVWAIQIDIWGFRITLIQYRDILVNPESDKKENRNKKVKIMVSDKQYFLLKRN